MFGGGEILLMRQRDILYRRIILEIDKGAALALCVPEWGDGHWRIFGLRQAHGAGGNPQIGQRCPRTVNAAEEGCMGRKGPRRSDRRRQPHRAAMVGHEGRDGTLPLGLAPVMREQRQVRVPPTHPTGQAQRRPHALSGRPHGGP